MWNVCVFLTFITAITCQEYLTTPLQLTEVYYNETALLLEELELQRVNPGVMPRSPTVRCIDLPEDLKICSRPIDCHGDFWCYVKENGFACLKMGGVVDLELMPYAWVRCRPTTNIQYDCNKKPHDTPNAVWFQRHPCVKYTGHFFTHTLFYSVFLGVFGVDRFCLGYVAHGIMKCITLGGFGIWWIIDIILVITYKLMPADGSNWNVYV